MPAKILPTPSVTTLAGFITLADALWWALAAAGLRGFEQGVYFDSPIWMGAFRGLPFLCLVLSVLLTYAFVRGGCRNTAIFCCGLAAGLLPLVAFLNGL